MTIFNLKGIIMLNIFYFFNKVFADSSNKNYIKNKDLIKYFKSEYGSSWRLELDKYLIN